MKFRSQLAALLLTVLLFPVSLYGISLNTRVVSVDVHPDFWLGLFPSTVSYMVEVGDLEFIPERQTSAGVELTTGTEARTITRDPVSGAPLSWFASGASSDIDYLIAHPDYDAMFAAWKLGVIQGFGASPSGRGDLLTLSASFNGQWETALDPILQMGTRTGHPFETSVFKNNTGSTLTGTPDLSGNRRMLDMSFSFGGKLNTLKYKTGQKSGVDFSFEVVWAPKFLCITESSGGKADFLRIWAYSSGGFMIYRKLDDSGRNEWSLGLSTDIEFRYLNGSRIPKYAERLEGSVWWYEPENTTFLLRNTTKLEYYGHQFFGSWVPRAYIFLDLNYAWGRLNNAVSYSIDPMWTGTLGFHVELEMFGFMHLYYEFGKMFLYTGQNPSFYKGYRSSESIKVKISLDL